MVNTVGSASEIPPRDEEILLQTLNPKIEGRSAKQTRLYVARLVRAYAEGRFDYDKVLEVMEPIRALNVLLFKKKESKTPEIFADRIAELEKQIDAAFPTPSDIREESQLGKAAAFAFLEEATARGIISGVISELIRARFDDILPVVNHVSVTEFLEIVSTRAKLVTDPKQAIDMPDEMVGLDPELMETYSLKQLVCLYLKTRLRDAQPGAETMYDPRIASWNSSFEKRLHHLLFSGE